MKRLDLRKLGPGAVERIRLAGDLAGERGVKAYLVGGAVRDMLLRRPNLDIDIVVEGDGIALARTWAEVGRAQVLAHPRFGTAVVVFDDGLRFDVVTARRESYSCPGALPDVCPGTLSEDLYRRDFTINAMAVSISPSEWGSLYDELGGLADLRDGMVRIIHRRSFVDDPTRILRAVRYEQRFGFRLSRTTLADLKTAMEGDGFATIAPVRYWNEFRRILEEDDPVPALGRLRGLGAWRCGPGTEGAVRLVEKAVRTVRRYRDVLSRTQVCPWRIYCAAILYGLGTEEAERVLTSFGVGRKDKRKILEVLQFAGLPVMLDTNSVRKKCESASLEALAFFVTACSNGQWARMARSTILERGGCNESYGKVESIV